MPSPRFFLFTSVAVLTFGPGLLAPSQAASLQPQTNPASMMAASRPLVIAQSKPDAEAQDQDSLPDQPAPPKPYKPVTVTLPKPVSDPSFEAFRKKLVDVAGRKDKGALAGLVAAKVFHLDSEGKDQADKQKSGLEYLSELLDLDSGEAFGWDSLAAAARDPTADPLQQRQGVVCGPGSASYDDKAFETLLGSTGTDEFEWAYAAAPVEVRATDKPGAPVVEKVGTILLRILPATGQENGGGAEAQSDALPVVVPSGKTGYVPGDALRALSSDKLCYAKDGGSWKIVGYVGAE
ncbi:MAG: hypothetical protein R3D62_12650 [Xanthobacteraceae bacterium]